MKKLLVLLAAMLTFATTAFAQIGSAASDLVFTPVTPCRILDTRPSQGGPGSIAAGATGSYYAGGLSSYASQGGAATNCGITAGLNVAAVSVNFTVVAPTTGGFITVFPYLGAQPTAATVNFVAGAIVGNSATVKVSQASVTAMSIYTTSTTDVVADIVGYYSKPVSVGSLECTTIIDSTTTVAANAVMQYIQAPVCAAGYSKVSTSCSHFGNSLHMRKQETYTNTASQCAYDNAAASTQVVFITSTCCRIPGR